MASSPRKPPPPPQIPEKVFGLDPDELVTPSKAASLLGISPNTMATWRCKKRYGLQYVKIGARVMYRAKDIADFINTWRTDG